MICGPFKRIILICILLGLVYLYSIVTNKYKDTYKRDMQKAEPGMSFITITAKLLLVAQIWMYGTVWIFITGCKNVKF